MIETVSREPIIEDPKEAFRGVDDFARRSLKLARFSEHIMSSAAKAIDSTQKLKESLRTNSAMSVSGKSTYPSNEAADSHRAYLERILHLAEINIKIPGDEDLFEAAFGGPPQHKIKVLRLEGGMVFICSEEDYETAYVYDSQDKELAAKKAEISGGFALWETTIADRIIPVAVVKRQPRIATSEFYDGALPDEPIPTEEIREIKIAYIERGVKKEATIQPLKLGDYEIPVLRLQRRTGIKDIYLPDDEFGPQVRWPIGPFELFATSDDVEFRVPVEALAEGSMLSIAHPDEGHFDDEITQTEVHAQLPIINHELQHLLQQLYRPLRGKLFEAKFKKNYQSEEELIKGAVDYFLRLYIDRYIQDEFLAQMMSLEEAIDPIGSLGQLLIKQLVEERLLYNYMPDRETVGKFTEKNKKLLNNPSKTTSLIQSKIAEQYPQFVLTVAWAVSNFKKRYHVPDIKLVALLASHPFHTWPTVLKSVQRYIDAGNEVGWLKDRTTSE